MGSSHNLDVARVVVIERWSFRYAFLLS